MPCTLRVWASYLIVWTFEATCYAQRKPRNLMASTMLAEVERCKKNSAWLYRLDLSRSRSDFCSDSVLNSADPAEPALNPAGPAEHRCSCCSLLPNHNIADVNNVFLNRTMTLWNVKCKWMGRVMVRMKCGRSFAEVWKSVCEHYGRHDEDT